MGKVTHGDLVEAGRKWLLKRPGPKGIRRGVCSVVLTEVATYAPETPDVIGWYDTISTMLEAKASRSDFLADRRKYFRRHEQYGMGTLRYYITPKSLVDPDELPEGWGLIEVSNGRTRVVRESRAFEAKRANEVTMLLSLIRRLKVKPGLHTAIRVYTCRITDPKGTATIEEAD